MTLTDTGYCSRFLLASLLALLAVPNYLIAQGKFDPFGQGKRQTNSPKSDVIASLEFVDTPITAVFRMISDLTGWSIMMSPEVSKQPPRINIWVKNLTPDQVLEQVASLGELVLERKGNTIKVMTFEEYARIFGVEKKVVDLKYASAKDVAVILKPFVAKNDQARILPDETGNKVVLLVAKPLIESLVNLIHAVDVPFEKDVVRIVKLRYQEAIVLVPALEDFLTQQASGVRRSSVTRPRTVKGKLGEGDSLAAAGESWIVQAMAEPKLNVVVLRGLAKDVERTVRLIESLDVPSGTEIRSYGLKYTNAREVFQTLKELVKEDQEAGQKGPRNKMPLRLRLSVSEQNNRIVIEGSPADHDKLNEIISAIDRPLPAGTGGMRVYRLENASADEVAKVLQDIVENQYNRSRDRMAKQERKAKSADMTKGKQLAAGDVLPPSISTAPEINAVIIRASAVEHEELGLVIAELDKPRDQVIIEVTLVTVRSDDTFDLGIELGGGRAQGSGVSSYGFTTFGIRAADPSTGAIRIGAPSFGLNYAIFNSKDFSLALNALQTVGNARITSAPKILVEDNAIAMISQYNQEPYEVVSQGESSTVSTFGGFVDAGTALQVTPHIADDGWLRLKYAINLSSFGNRTAQQEAANLPPPRRETRTNGTVRIPAEHMVVLGGLIATREDNSEDSVPLLSGIPFVGELFKTRSRNKVNETLFIFIRPVILQDPGFVDLLSFSEQELERARISNSGHPQNPFKMPVPSQVKGEPGDDSL